MQFIQHTDAKEFLAATQSALEQDEAANNLMLGLATRLRNQPERIKVPPYFATVSDGVGVVAAALMTPPNRIVVYANRDAATNQAALAVIADDLVARQWPVPGVTGPSQPSDSFLEIWQAKTGAKLERVVRERVYKLTQVTPPPTPSGHFRVATLDDLDTITVWDQAFGIEALHQIRNADTSREDALFRIRQGAIFVWDHAGPVSCAVQGRPTRTGIAIGFVYTPPELRGHGYASACVAALSQHCLDSGRQFCMLFTDLSNPTSNRIYQKMGYQPVCDFNEYAFA